MGREVRKVPAGWEHPTDNRGDFIPLFGGSFKEALAEWEQGRELWGRGLRFDFSDSSKVIEHGEDCTWEEWGGPRPVESDYMPDWPEEERTHFMMYESTSEGTPISPAFATEHMLAAWLVSNGASRFGYSTATYDVWMSVINGGFGGLTVIAPADD